ncbi:hypothetical protein N8230_03255 [Gammaproteobacteria bacterium]|nr:hypothetical protein [Gammaproteobacteria bacterium]
MFKIKPNVIAGVTIALLIIVPMISVGTIRYEPLGDSGLATIYKEDIFTYVCVIALYGIGYALINFFYWLLKTINNELFEDFFGPLIEQRALTFLVFAPVFVMTFVYPLMNYITNY